MLRPSRHRRRAPHRGPLRTGLTLVVLAAAFVAVPDLPAGAEHECREEVEISPSGRVRIIRVCEPHEDDGDGSGGNDDVSCQQTIWPVGTEPIGEGLDGGPFLWWREIDARDDGSTWGEGHFWCTNRATGELFESSWWVCFLACGGGGDPDPVLLDGLLQQALAQVNPPLPGIRHTFDRPADDGTVRAVVNAETWWWAGGDQTAIVRTDSDGPVWVRVTAAPGALTVDPGDGSAPIECAGLGIPYNHDQSYWDQAPGEPRGACVHVYERAAESVTASMSVTWTVTYEGFAPGVGNVSGALAPVTRAQTATFAVKEIQSVIVR